MSATDELRRMLDERGIHWWAGDDERKTLWESNGLTWEYFNDENGDAWLGFLGACEQDVTPEQAIAATLGNEINGETSDGYHTFNELYHHRAVLFSVIVRDHREIAWKARKHHDGTMYDGMFIVGIETPKGQATYHYDIDPYWEMFDCEEREFAPEWDGHTPDDAIARIAAWNTRAERTCREYGSVRVWQTCNIWSHELSCGHEVDTLDNEPPNYCPSCGVKVIGGNDA